MNYNLYMNTGDSFFFFFLGTIAVTRFILAFPKRPKTFIAGLRIRHYLFGIIAVLVGFLVKNAMIYAIGLGLIADELILVIAKGSGLKDEQWRGCEDYFTPWSVAAVFVITFLVFVFRDFLVGLI